MLKNLISVNTRIFLNIMYKIYNIYKKLFTGGKK